MDQPPVDHATLTSMHALAEHVLCAALHQATGRIGLRVSDGGFSTPSFGDDQRRVTVDGTTLVAGPPGAEHRAELTTLAAAAELAGVAPGAPANVFTPTTACDPEASLDIDPAFARALAAWYALGDAALHAWAAELSPEHPATTTLWPEHFDVAIRAGEVNYGAAPADGTNPTPYLYVGPPPELLAGTTDGFWNAPFGAARPWEDVDGVEDAVSFFRTGYQLLSRLREGER